jgi:hypothetical protein
MMLFCLPGIYLALTGLGAGGGRPSSQAVAANVNAILYGVFFLVGWFGGSIMNIVGPNVTISISAIGYALYTGMCIPNWLLSQPLTKAQAVFGTLTRAAVPGWHTSVVLWTACAVDYSGQL